MTTMAHDLDPLFAPRSVAVYGASAADPGKLGNKLLANAADGAIPVVCVHPSAGEIAGVPARPSLDRPVDLALVSVPAAAAEKAVHDAVTAGARTVVVLSSGFGEAGPEGRAAEQRIVELVRAHGARLVGPNCMGVVSRLDDGTWLNGSYFWSVPRRAGALSFVSQSGAFGGMFLSEVRRRELGFARFLSLGNSPDVDVTHALTWLASDPETQVIGVFTEGLRDGRAFVEVARSITPHKPVVVLKGGRGGAGARAVAGHTGSLAGSARAYEAGFQRAGVVSVEESAEFFDVLTAFSAPSFSGPSFSGPSPRRHGSRVAVVTVSGGPGVLAADAAERHGLELPPLPPRRQAAIRALAPEFAALGNPVDLTPQCPPANFRPAIRAVYEEDGIDGVIVVNCGLDIPEFGAAVAEAFAATRKPTTAFLLDVGRVRKAVAGAGIPCFDLPESAVRGYAAGVAR
ncbi:acetate--CoA ligase family protein [Nonomuraea basaltis]|uniref:acetate--CoA ligase family protein n=1 Tax=Nonomuraea basaltis TaxID=2495887 RepID=UPI001487265D|nr:CoA-binding protein [Nonomuraea basaltis]